MMMKKNLQIIRIISRCTRSKESDPSKLPYDFRRVTDFVRYGCVLYLFDASMWTLVRIIDDMKRSNGAKPIERRICYKSVRNIWNKWRFCFVYTE